MGLSSKQKALVIGLLIFGGIILSNGILKITLAGADILSEGFVLIKVMSGIVKGHSITDATTAKTTISPVRDVEGIVDVSFSHKNGTIAGNIHTIIKMKTREAWTSDNEIRYNISSLITGTNKINDIFFVTTRDAERSLDYMNKTGYMKYKEEYENEGLIQLIQENPYRWSKQGNFTLPLKMVLSFVGGYGIGNDGYRMATEPIVEIESASVKIQADASRALIQQINETKKTNHIIEGLTWILISVIPIGFSFEVFLREYYHNKRISSDQHHISEDSTT